MDTLLRHYGSARRLRKRARAASIRQSLFDQVLQALAPDETVGSGGGGVAAAPQVQVGMAPWVSRMGVCVCSGGSVRAVCVRWCSAVEAVCVLLLGRGGGGRRRRKLTVACDVCVCVCLVCVPERLGDRWVVPGRRQVQEGHQVPVHFEGG